MKVTAVVLGASVLRLAHQGRGHVAGAVLDVETAGDLDLLHFLARRNRDAERALDLLVFRRRRRDEVDPHRALGKLVGASDRLALERISARNINRQHAHPHRMPGSKVMIRTKCHGPRVGPPDAAAHPLGTFRRMPARICSRMRIRPPPKNATGPGPTARTDARSLSTERERALARVRRDRGLRHCGSGWTCADQRGAGPQALGLVLACSPLRTLAAGSASPW